MGHPHGGRALPSRRASAILTMASVFAVAVACGGGTATTGTPSTPSTSPRASGTAAGPSATPSASPTGPVPLSVGLLGAGTYTTTAFDPTLAFMLGEGWIAVFPDDEDELALDHSGTLFGATRPSQVIDPVSGKVVPAPDDMAGWLAAHPRLTRTKPVPIRIGARQGLAVDVEPAAGQDDVPIFHFPTGDFHLPQGTRARFHVLAMDGPDLVIQVVAERADFQEALDLAAPILDSLVIAP